MLMLHSLEKLWLSNCGLGDGTLLEGRFVNSSSMLIFDIDLSLNYLSLATLDWLFNIRSLAIVNLARNQLGGLIPYSIQNLTFLEYLDLSSNMIRGGNPKSLENFSHLQSLRLSHNNITETLVELIENISCKALESLWLDNNQLSGSVPDFNSFVSLRKLHLEDNGLKDLPISFAHLVNLEYLDLYGNSLEGIVRKATFNKLQNLQTLDLSFNPALHISFDWNPPSMLETLIVRYVNLGPKFPTWLQLLRNLYEVIPSEVAHHEICDEDGMYASVQWKMKEYEYRENLRFLRFIDLPSNELTGYIPQELFDLQGLISLNLSRNSLEGSIPHAIGHMEMIESLDLSRNHLSGAIPPSLCQLNFLQILDLSYNNLSGKIPTGTQLQSFIESAYVGNAHLCGRPLALCSGDDLQTPDSIARGKDKERMNAFMSLSFMQDLYISMVLGFVFGFYGFIGSLILKRSWRVAYFNFFGGVGDWIYVKIATDFPKFRLP